MELTKNQKQQLRQLIILKVHQHPGKDVFIIEMLGEKIEVSRVGFSNHNSGSDGLGAIKR